MSRDEAVKVAADVLWRMDATLMRDDATIIARKAIAATAPIIEADVRAKIAAEIEEFAAKSANGPWQARAGLRTAARIARGES
jgi:hypothetical protein